MQDHFDNQIAKVAKFSLLHVGEYVAVMLLNQLEKCRNMMVFKDSSVIIENSQTGARIDVKVVGGARMVEIVDNGCHQGREDFQVRHPILKYVVYLG